ncbi:shikimate dehydrogenase family protein [Vibrio mangrovi]|uniref:Quinate dehydrogenase n=1 Tax=Vibrio mangrovi TaxID=474394 RepID=A0A1Y6J0E8_9VIBR|nr:quinate dehydrogenase [Vibrio mangrovi]MDW6005239.1 quinate dehydrogenase [Vibrio mangrovi]SMS02550.1 Quinate/shikimate dehydrogenase [Vibrio mangrovi]
MKLGLVGQRIQKSQSKKLHEYLGEYYNLGATYDYFDIELDGHQALEDKLAELKEQGYRGVNVTFPYKVWAWDLIEQREHTDPTLGALNTVVLNEDQIKGTNTDCTGFARALQTGLEGKSAGKVLLKGTGGVGRAIAFGLARCDAEHIYLYDESADSQTTLLHALTGAGISASIVEKQDIDACARQCDGLVNATPIGHYTMPGSLFPAELLGSQSWAFDAVYTPVMTQFLTDAQAAGLTLITGFELFLYQGIDAFEFFTGVKVDPEVVRSYFAETGK